MPTVSVREGQTLWDIAIQESGSIEAAFELAELNGLSVTDDLIANQVLTTATIRDSEIVTFFSSKNRKPASAIGKKVRPGGIDYMQIGNDFKVN